MYITIKTFNKISKADYVKYRLELAQIDCQIESVGADDSNMKFQVKVPQNDVETAVDELLRLQKEYPNEDFENIIDPCELTRILIPIDFSEKSLEACRFALGMAEKLPIEMKLLYVWNDELEDAVAVRHTPSIEDFKRMERNEIKRNISESIDRFNGQIHAMIKEANTKGVLFHFTVNEGKITRQVVETAKKYQPQLIIIAHNDKKENHFRITQAISTEIIDKALCPVMYIPVKAKFKPFNNIMYATNFDNNATKSLTELHSLFSPFNSSLNCVHISLGSDNEGDQQKMNALISNLKEKGVNGNIHSEVLVMNKLMKGLDSYIIDKDISLVSFTSPSYSIWHKMFSPDNRKMMMTGSKVPILVFKY